MRTPVAIGAGMVALNAALAYALMSVLGVAGIALATAIVAFVTLGLLMLTLSRTLGGLDGARIAGTAARAAAAALLGGAAGWWVLQALAHQGAGLLGQGQALGAALGAAALVYLAVCIALRVEEVALLRDLLRQRGVR
jgi:putative peptidoglycan lipid II flippase